MVELSWLPRGPWMGINPLSLFTKDSKSLTSSYWPTSWAFNKEALKAALMKICEWVTPSETFELFALAFIMVLFAYMSFHPFLKIIMRRPLRVYAGMEFGDFKISPMKLSLTFIAVEMYPVDSPIIKGLFSSLFPSAIVQTYEKSVDYPASKISIKRMKVGLRTRSILSSQERYEGSVNTLSRWAKQLLKMMLHQPILSVELKGVIMEVEKAYIAPRPPPEFHTPWQDSLPSAVSPSSGIGPEIPMFDQEFVLDFLRDDELQNAEKITFLMERWLQHAGKDSKKGTNTNSATTDDDNMNARLQAILIAFLHSISIELSDAAIIISGADSQFVKDTRKHHDPCETNLILAKLPKRSRALTVIGADAITISCSHDPLCNLLLCFVGAHVKVGNPFPGAMDEAKTSASEVAYAWHTIAHPFDLVLELQGIVPLLVWALFYDHHWNSRSLSLSLTASEIIVSLSPIHLQTLLLHLDDFTDPLSSFNEWFTWLSNKNQQRLKLGLDESQKRTYCHNYARLHGAILYKDPLDSNFGDEQRLTTQQLKAFELCMTRYEIMSLRCIAMKKSWRIPKRDQEFDYFLRSSHSSIRGKGDDSPATPLDVLSPFNRLHQTPQHALATLTLGKYGFLSPGVKISFSTKSLQYDFPDKSIFVGSKEASPQRTTVPSSLTLSDLFFELQYMDPLFSTAPSSSSGIGGHRPLLGISIEASRVDWEVVGANELDLPTFLNKSFVGIIYQQRQAPASAKVLSANLQISVAPTRNQDPLITLDLQSYDLVFVVNPLPLISAMQNLIDLSDIPFRPPEEVVQNSHKDNETSAIISTNIKASVNNTSILLMSDKDTHRGILILEIDQFAAKLQSSGMSGNAEISSFPIELHAGQMIQYPTSQPNNAGIQWRLMPYKPILIIDGPRFRACGKEKHTGTTAPHLATPDTRILCIHVEAGTDSFQLNVSPSTLVALMGFSSSLGPFLQWAGGDAEEEARIRREQEMKLEEEKLSLHYRREALRAIFNSVDVDESGTLQEEELEKIVLMLFAENTGTENDASQIVNGAQRLTPAELKRERDYLIGIIDAGHTNQVSFQGVHSILFRMAYGIDDNNLTPKIGVTGIDYLDKLAHSTAFLSAPTMRRLVYFDDLREYASMHEVYRITGYARLENGWTFPAPSLWRQGTGIDLFWNLYTTDTGCTPNSLNGQEISSVQRKLVRSLCNYQFAKFCWKTLVQQQLHAACNNAEGTNNENNLTSWLLDNDPQGRITAGVIDRLLRHVDQISKDTKERQQKGAKEVDIQFEISVVASVDSAILRFGSSHTFTNPLFEANFSQVSINASALISSNTGWFVPEVKGEDILVPTQMGQPEREMGNEIHFQSTVSVHYLNMKHDHMEGFIETYPTFGQISYKTFLQETLIYYGDDPETSTFTLNINCPRSMNINALPAFFGAASMLAKIWGQLDPEKHRLMILQRDIKCFEKLWDARDETKSGLSYHEAVEVLILAANHWKDEVSGLTPGEKDSLLSSLCNMPEENDNGAISFHDVKEALLKSSKCYFSYFTGCQVIQLQNATGRELKVSAASDSFITINAEDTSAIPLHNLQNASQSSLSFSIDRYKPIRHVAVSPYQSLMLPLIRQRRKSGLLRRRKQLSASGFSPHLTVVPKQGNLDSIALTVRPCVTIQTDIPIRIRIVRLSKSLGYLRAKKTRQIDLSKKNLVAALKRIVEGALIVYEKDDITKGVEAPLPLYLLDSSHYHALLVQDLTGQSSGTWRDPVLLTKDFLFNPMGIRQVSRCHALSGVVIHKERLNICLADKKRNTPISSDDMKSILRRTSWDTTIQVVPFFLLSNSMPFPILARTWQLPKIDESNLWRDPAFLAGLDDDDDDMSSDEDLSSGTPSSKGRGTNPDQFHQPSVAGQSAYFSLDTIERGETLRLSGINLRQPLFLQISQRLDETSILVNETDLMWSRPLQIKLAKLRTGVNPTGSFSLPKLSLDLGDNCSALLDVSIERGIRMPICTIYSPYWLINKTGAKLEYKTKISKKPVRYLDSGTGGMPIMMHCGKSDRELHVIPLESPSLAVAQNWWDTTSNGKLVLKQHAIKGAGYHLVEQSDKIVLDTAGTSNEVQCKNIIFSVSIESLAGAFYRSNLITFTPRFIVKNMLHIPITLLPISGSKSEAMQKATQLRHSLAEDDKKRMLRLNINESTIIYHFMDVSFAKGIEKSHRWAAFSVNSTRQSNEFTPKWHLIPIDKIGSTYFGEHDGFNDTVVGIMEAKVHGYDGARVVSISHATVPPFRIENRSNHHHIQFVQDDNNAVVFELPPMHSSGYCWDSPHGTKRLRAVVIPADKSRFNLFEGAVEGNISEDASFDDSSSKHIQSDISDDDFFGEDDEATDEPLKNDSHCNKSIISAASSRLSRSKSRFSMKGRRLFGMKSRSYTMSKVGSKRNLPCPITEKTYSTLKVHLRISAGTKVLSFNDSPWLIEQVEQGLLRKGGDFKDAYCNINFDGLSFYLMDDFPRELMGVIVRDVQIYKPMGSIEATAKVRHFQVDAMVENARYPIIIQPKEIGVERHGHIHNNAMHGTRQASVDERDCFWLQNNESGQPIFELAFSYVPQSNMTWVPNVEIYVCPMKLQVDVDYILRVVGMVINSISKYQDSDDTNLTKTTHANNKLQYVSYGQLNARLTYIEKLYIAPVWFEFEINIKPDELDHSASESEAAGEAALTLNSIARSTNSAAVAGILSWVINVGANFAHVSPTFRYATITYEDRYCDILDLARNIAISYIVQSIKQSYKVVFSMHLLGDPSLLAHQYRTGVSDLVFRTRDEVVAGGNEGFGKGLASFSEHVVGGTFFAFGKVTGGFAKTLDSLITNELTSNHLKPKLTTDRRKRPRHAIEGLAQGTMYFGKTIVYGTAGLIGNPYRGAKLGLSITGSMAGFTKGAATGLIGLAASPVIGGLGFMAKTSDGLGSTARYLEVGTIEARCRPARSVPWGRPMSDNGISYLKAIGIRVHTVRYQKIRKKIVQKDDEAYNDDDNDYVTSKEYKRIKAAEERRKNPPRKVVNILYNKENRQYVTTATKPKLLTDRPTSRTLTQDHFAVCYEETLILESSDLQLSDQVLIQFRNSRVLKSRSRSKLSGVCTLTVGDMYSSILHFYSEQLKHLETSLSKEIIDHISSETPISDARSQSASEGGMHRKALIIPAPQEYSLFRPSTGKGFVGDILEAVGEEMASIQEADAEALNTLDSDSVHSDSDSSFLYGTSAKKATVEDGSKIVRANERLFGSISLSFFPVLR